MPRSLRRAAAWLVVCAAVALSERVAHAQQRARVELSAGGDSNPALASDPLDRAMMDSNVVRPSAVAGLDAFADLTLAGGDRYRLALGPYLGVRGYSAAHAFVDGGSALTLHAGGDRVRLDLGALAGGYGATFGLDNAGYVEALLGMEFALGEWHRLRTEGYYQLRAYRQGQRDHLRGGAITLTFGARHAEGFFRASADYRGSTTSSVLRTEVAGTAGLALFDARHRVSITSTVASRWYLRAPRDGIEWLGSLRYDYRANHRLGFFATVQAGWARGRRGATESLEYGRGGGQIGITLHFERPAAPPPNLDQGPARVLPDGRVRFRLRAEGAREVALLAEFLDWDPSRGALEDQGDGWFEGTFDPGPGRHRYRFLVDGEDVLPDAPAYAPDGFGGRDAVLRIEDPEAPDTPE